MRRLLCLAMTCCALSACGVDENQEDVSEDVCGDIVTDVAPDSLADVTSPDSADGVFDAVGAWQWCSAGGMAAVDTPILPRPFIVKVGGGANPGMPVERTSWLSGVDGTDETEMVRLDATGGFERVADRESAGLSVVVHDAADWDAARAACAPDLPESAEAYLLEWSAGADGRHVMHVVAPGSAGRLMAFKTARQLYANAVPAAAGLLVADAPAAKYRGIIETFYGAPYDEADRLAILPYLADMKFNQYIYAGKMDLFTDWIGTYWSDEWPQEYLDMLRRLAVAVKREGMVPGVQLRIGQLSLAFSSDADMEKFLEKIRLFFSLGYELFSLSFDDTEKVLLAEDEAVYESYDAATIDFSKRAFEILMAEYPHVMFGWVPADYWTEATDAPVSLPLAGDNIPAGVSIGWTGRQIVPATITAADADDIASWLKRPPLLGDNYPVVEKTNSTLYLGPLVGRAPDLVAHLDGIMFNPMPFPFASLPALATCADYAWNARAYDPETSRANMSRFLAGTGGPAAALAILSDVDRSPQLSGDAAPALKAEIDDLWAQVEAGGALETAALRDDWFQPFAAVPEQWAAAGSGDQAGPSPELLAALSPFAEQLGRYGDAGLLALDILSAQAAGTEPSAATVDAFRAKMSEIAASERMPTGHLMQDFLDRVNSGL